MAERVHSARLTHSRSGAQKSEQSVVSHPNALGGCVQRRIPKRHQVVVEQGHGDRAASHLEPTTSGPGYITGVESSPVVHDYTT